MLALEIDGGDDGVEINGAERGGGGGQHREMAGVARVARREHGGEFGAPVGLGGREGGRGSLAPSGKISQHRWGIGADGNEEVERAGSAGRKVEVEFTEENDIAFKVIYPRPPPGRLHFHGAFLKKLGEGYGGIIEINDAAGLNLGWEQLSAENPNFEITVPAAKPAPKKP